MATWVRSPNVARMAPRTTILQREASALTARDRGDRLSASQYPRRRASSGYRSPARFLLRLLPELHRPRKGEDLDAIELGAGRIADVTEHEGLQWVGRDPEWCQEGGLRSVAEPVNTEEPLVRLHFDAFARRDNGAFGPVAPVLQT